MMRYLMIFLICVSVISTIELFLPFGRGMAQDLDTIGIAKRLSSSNQWPGKLPSSTGRGEPIFPPDYNWDEHDQIEDTIIELCNSKDPLSWEILVSLAGEYDHIYCVTLLWNLRTSSNFSVSEICRLIATHRLLTPISQSIGGILVKQPGYLGFIETKIGVDDTCHVPRIIEWRRKHAALQLWELQELCIREAIAIIDADARLDLTLRSKTNQQLTDFLTTIQREKSVIPTPGALSHLGYDFYDKKTANDSFIDFARRFPRVRRR